MTRELLILRHGKSDWDMDTDDFHRPLTNRGKRSAQRIGVWLASHGKVPDYIVSSPAERALLTAEKSCKVMGIGVENIVHDQRIYGAGLTDLLQVIRELPAAAERVLLVGHNPGLEELLETLADSPLELTEDRKLLATATLAVLTTNEDWSVLQAGSATVQNLIRSRSLPKKFPWPLLDTKEQRKRPAYYYTQSSVIPYRLRDGEPEVLLVRSSKNKRWIVPKGIHEPGLTAQQSAAKEALEEAGVEGVVEDGLGHYHFPKWGASCTVEVYAMKVTHVLPERDWPERHRTRKWLSLARAAQLIQQAELASMIPMIAERGRA